MSSSSATVLLLATDLMLSSTVDGQTAAEDLIYRNVGTAADAWDYVHQANGRVLLLVDLGTPGLDVTALAEAMPAAIIEQAVAYGPHVHEAKLQNAVEAGFGRVMSRGQFSAQVSRLIAAFARDREL